MSTTLQALRASSLNRRLLLQLPAAAGMALSGPGLAWAALDPVTAVQGNRRPSRGGVLVRAMAGPPPNFDPLSNTTSRVLRILGPCCNGLVRYAEFDANKIVPDLAQSWQLSDDGLAYTFRLRPGVKFHDGKPLTSADVQYTFDTLRAPPPGVVSMRAKLLEAVARIEAPDALTVRFVLHRPSPALLANLAGGWMVVLPKHLLEKGPIKDTIVGTGPFMLKEYKRGTSIELVRNPNYHIPGKPYLDGQKIFFIPNQNTEYAYLRSGRLDVIDTNAPNVALQWEKEAVVRGGYLVGGPSQSQLALHFNGLHAPWNDVRVRQAACLAINREDALKTLMGGQGVIGGWTCPGPWALSAADMAKIPAYGPYSDANLVRAKALLAQAGLPHGFKDVIVVRRVDLYTPLAIFVKDQLLKIGIDVTIDPQETAAYNATRSGRRFKLDAGGRSVLTNDPDAIFGDSITCDGAANYASVCDAGADALFTRLSQETNVAKRVAQARQLELHALQTYASFPLFWRNQYRCFQKNVHGWAKHPQEDNSLRMEDCWKSAS